MNRRYVLAVLGTATALAGCVADDSDDSDRSETDTNGSETDADEESVIEHFDDAPARPECEHESETVEVERDGETHEYETAETVPYPDAPSAFGEDDVVEFVETFEHAYVTHDVLCDGQSSSHVLEVGYGVQTSESFEWYDDLEIVFLLRAAGASQGIDDEGYEWAADLGYSGVVYAVDETGVARAEFDEAATLEPEERESRAPDPLDEGSLVAAFE